MQSPVKLNPRLNHYYNRLCDQRIPHLQACLGELAAATLEKWYNVIKHVMYVHNHHDPLAFWVKQWSDLHNTVDEFAEVFALNLVWSRKNRFSVACYQHWWASTYTDSCHIEQHLLCKNKQRSWFKDLNSPRARPVSLVDKKDGSTQFCIDYWYLNLITKLNNFLLPSIDDSLDLMAKTAWFQPSDYMYGSSVSAFCLHSGPYEFTVMPFRLCNTPVTFQKLMETMR